MKFLITLLLSVVALVSAAALDPDYSLVQREVEDAIADGNKEIIAHDLDNGRSKIEIIINGVNEGYLIAAEDGTVQAFDAQGNEIEINDNDSEDDDDIVKRSKFKVLIRLAKVIKKYGKRALSFFKCISWNTTLHCASQIEYCAITAGKAPWFCTQALKCIGKAGKHCV